MQGWSQARMILYHRNKFLKSNRNLIIFLSALTAIRVSINNTSTSKMIKLRILKQLLKILTTVSISHNLIKSTSNNKNLLSLAQGHQSNNHLYQILLHPLHPRLVHNKNNQYQNKIKIVLKLIRNKCAKSMINISRNKDRKKEMQVR